MFPEKKYTDILKTEMDFELQWTSKLELIIWKTKSILVQQKEWTKWPRLMAVANERATFHPTQHYSQKPFFDLAEGKNFAAYFFLYNFFEISSEKLDIHSALNQLNQ